MGRCCGSSLKIQYADMHLLGEEWFEADAGQPGCLCLGHPGTAWFTLGRPGSPWDGLVHPGTAWFTLGRPGSVCNIFINLYNSWIAKIDLGINWSLLLFE